MRIAVSKEDAVFDRFHQQLKELGPKGRVALARAANQVGKRALTAVRRALVLQTSAPRSLVVEATEHKTASTSGSGSVDSEIFANGRYIPLAKFGAREFSKGVRAKVWGKFQTFPGTFIVASLGGNVYKRTSKARFPIKKLWGPSIPNEMVKEASLEAWKKFLPEYETRVAHEIERLLDVAK